MNDINKINQINSYFLTLRKQSSFLSALFSFFDAQEIAFGFLGGSVRAALSGSKKKPRDLDIIFDGSDSLFDDFLEGLNISYKKNSFGGRKIEVDNFKFDVWSLSNHHLISDEIYKHTFKNVPRTTFINYDSIFYDWTKNKLYDNYSSCLENNLIDLVGNKKAIESNYRFDVTLCKLATLQNKGFSFSERLNNYISSYLNDFFDSNSLFEKNDLFDSFIYGYMLHNGNRVGCKKKAEIKDFLTKYL